jgi:16S rRNA (cytidine1402-2'-O)-methyltransferase
MPSNSPIPEGDPAGSCGCLYIVATPIGHASDITLRALEILTAVDLIAAEDTRRSGRLLTRHGIKNKFVSLHEHNEKRRTPALIRRLQAGQRIALVSNAGTPSVSDPGYRLVTEAVSAGIPVVPLPGPCAAVCALSAAGLPTDAFVFIGFPPPKKGKRRLLLEALTDQPYTVVFYESPRRMLRLLEEAAEIMGERNCVLAREMTKRHEEFLRGSLSEVHDVLQSRSDIKGECTLLVAGAGQGPQDADAAWRKALYAQMSEGVDGLAGRVKQIARRHGVSRKKVYAEALRLKHGRHRPGSQPRKPTQSEDSMQ